MTPTLPTGDTEATGDSTPERRLMVAIILAAIRDAIGMTSDAMGPSQKERERTKARQWFAEKGADFCIVCLSAGLNPDEVSEVAQAYIRAQDDGSVRRGLSFGCAAQFRELRAAA